ncbi:JAB domain-containing protein [Ruminococcus sp. 5_1_39BFAA]|uniref:JAB domain-containing protein n=1 Tax=Ruminococcus sp. 5_1_39BFAA TaxID=457412 RepID=UPI003565BC3A
MPERYGLEQVSIRMVRDAPLISEESIETPEDAIRLLGETFKDYDREVVGVVHLRNDNSPINMTIVSMGCLNQSIVHPREMMKAAFLSNASSILMFHNHPAGSLSPSKNDIAITNRMQQVCMMAGIPMLDHIILGKENYYYSFREKGILPMEEVRYSTSLSDVDLKVAEKEAEKYGYQKAEKSSPKKSIKSSLAEKKKLAGASKDTKKRKTMKRGPEL